MIKIEKYQSIPFFADAVQVTEENLEEVAEWCSGQIRTNAQGAKYVKVRANKPKRLRHTMAFAGDWVIYRESSNSLRVYPDEVFKRSLKPVFQEKDEDILRKEAASS